MSFFAEKPMRTSPFHAQSFCRRLNEMGNAVFTDARKIFFAVQVKKDQEKGCKETRIHIKVFREMKRNRPSESN